MRANTRIDWNNSEKTVNGIQIPVLVFSKSSLSSASSPVRDRNLLAKYNHIKAMLSVTKQFKSAYICLVITSSKYI